MIYCIPLDSATEEFYASVARAAGLPMEQVLRDALFKLAGELSLEALASGPEPDGPGRLRIKYAAALN